MNVNRFEGARVRIAASGSASAVLVLFLGDVGIPMLLHRRADEDVEHRVLDVLFDQSAECRVIELGRVNVGLVLVGFAERYDLRATKKSQKMRKIGFRTSEMIQISNEWNHRAHEVTGC